MSAPGQYLPTMPVISTWNTSVYNQAALTITVPTSTQITSSANLAIYFPVIVEAPLLVRKIWTHNGTSVSGNIDLGIYTAGGAKLYSTGSTAQSGTSAVQSVTLGTPFFLVPDLYYLAIAADNTTATVFGTPHSNEDLRRMGLFTQATAFPLPATATFASNTLAIKAPLVGITNRTVI